MTPKRFPLWVLTTLAATSVTTVTGCNLSKSFLEHQKRALTSKTLPTSKSWQKVQLLRTLTGTAPIAISPNGQILASDSSDGKIKL
jgi:hypothetical protein